MAVTASGERLCKKGREGRRVWLLATFLPLPLHQLKAGCAVCLDMTG